MPQEPSELFQPLSWYPLGNGESVRLAQPRFPKWLGESPGSDYGGKPICDYRGRPAFGELLILWSCQAAGWEGAWVTHAGGKAKYRRGFWGAQEEIVIPSDVQGFLDGVAAKRDGSVGGTWDIVLWDPSIERVLPTAFRFVEAKYGPDKVKPAQIDWYEKVRAEGAPKSSFLLVDWSQFIDRKPAT